MASSLAVWSSAPAALLWLFAGTTKLAPNLAAILGVIGCFSAVQAHPLSVVPEAERLPAPEARAIEAPSSNAGILAVKDLGSQPLGGDFRALEGRALRLRELTIAPGGHIGLHRHDQRPGVAYLLEGSLTERRGPSYSPVVLNAGQAAFETTGVSHWWRNETDQPVRAIVVDIVEEPMPSRQSTPTQP
jgi:quercetin dioxygenase-like cupin family protein